MQQIELLALGIARERRIAQIADGGIAGRRAGTAKSRALIDRWQEGVAVVARPAVTRGGRDRHEARQIGVLRAETVENPGAHRRPDEVRRPAMQEQGGRPVGDAFGVHRVDEAEIVDV